MSMNQMMGTIVMFAGNFAPTNYALCQGQLLSIAQNSALFSILGTTYGGDGRTTFGLPDLRGRSPIGAGPGPGLSPINTGQQGGTPSVTLTASNLPMHTHLLNCDNTGSGSRAPGGQLPGLSDDRGAAVAIYSGATPNATMNPAACGAAGGGQPFNNADPSLGINFIICTQGIYPSRN